MRRVLLLLAPLPLLAGCFGPSVPEGLACGQDGECPPGQGCFQNLCVSSAPAVDGGLIDFRERCEQRLLFVDEFSTSISPRWDTEIDEEDDGAITLNGVGLTLNAPALLRTEAMDLNESEVVLLVTRTFSDCEDEAEVALVVETPDERISLAAVSEGNKLVALRDTEHGDDSAQVAAPPAFFARIRFVDRQVFIEQSNDGVRYIRVLTSGPVEGLDEARVVISAVGSSSCSQLAAVDQFRLYTAPEQGRCALTQLSDPFDGESLSPAWLPYIDAGRSRVEGGAVVLSFDTAAPGLAVGMQSRDRFVLAGGALEIETDTFPTGNAPAYALARVDSQTSSGFFFQNTSATAINAGMVTTSFDVLAGHRYWRMREQGAMLFWESSADRANWMLRATQAYQGTTTTNAVWVEIGLAGGSAPGVFKAASFGPAVP